MIRLFGKSTGPSPLEVELMVLLRASPTEILTGRDLILAQGLAGRGLLRKIGVGRFALTEKGSVSYLAKHKT